MISSHILKLARDRRPHDAIPAGVPAGYDWQRGPVVYAGLDAPKNCKAFTGWGHALIAEQAKPSEAVIEVRGMETWDAFKILGRRRWVRRQAGPIAGGRYFADYSSNDSHPLGEFTAAKLPRDMAVHWWPSSGRDYVKNDCVGIVVRFQARASAPRAVLIGGGADYWTTLTAPWDGTTNPPIGMGRLRWCTTRWQWFAFGVMA